jgi:AcrR family transcriptional regulator
MVRESTPEKCGSYHHGDLRNALIIAAGQLIEERGSVEFAMIDAARRANVSSAAPYRHFKDKDALLEAVTEVAFMALTELTRETAAAHEAGSTAGIIAIGKAYVRFVTDHPEFYDLMWGDLGLRALDPGAPGLKTSGFYVMVEQVDSWCRAHALPDYNALDLSVRLWALAHGLACLAMNRQIEMFLPGADVYSLLEGSTHTFLNGLTGMSPPPPSG